FQSAGESGRVSRDFAGVGAGCLFAGLTGSFPVDSSPPNTALVHESGGRSQLASLIAVITVAALVLIFGNWLSYVPHAALAGVLVFIATRIFDVAKMQRILRYGGWEIVLVVVCAALVVALPIQTGMVLSIVLSLLHSVYAVARPLCTELVREPGTTIWW